MFDRCTSPDVLELGPVPHLPALPYPAHLENGPLGSSPMDLLLVPGGLNQRPPLARLGCWATPPTPGPRGALAQNCRVLSWMVSYCDCQLELWIP